MSGSFDPSVDSVKVNLKNGPILDVQFDSSIDARAVSKTPVLSFHNLIVALKRKWWLALAIIGAAGFCGSLFTIQRSVEYSQSQILIPSTLLTFDVTQDSLSGDEFLKKLTPKPQNTQDLSVIESKVRDTHLPAAVKRFNDAHPTAVPFPLGALSVQSSKESNRLILTANVPNERKQDAEAIFKEVLTLLREEEAKLIKVKKDALRERVEELKSYAQFQGESVHRFSTHLAKLPNYRGLLEQGGRSADLFGTLFSLEDSLIKRLTDAEKSHFATQATIKLLNRQLQGFEEATLHGDIRTTASPLMVPNRAYITLFLILGTLLAFFVVFTLEWLL